MMKYAILALPLACLLSTCTPELSTPPETVDISSKLDSAPRQTFPCWSSFSIPVPADEYEISRNDHGDFWTFTVNRKDGNGGMLIYNGHNPQRPKKEGEKYVADIAGDRITGRKIPATDTKGNDTLEFYRINEREDEDVYHIIIYGEEEHHAPFLGMLRRLQLHKEIPMPPPPSSPQQ